MASERMTLHVEATAAPEVGLGEIGLFFYDLATLYELIRLGLDPVYRNYRFDMA